MPISYRRIGADDTALLAGVADGVFDEPIDPKRLKTYLGTPGNLMVLAFDGDLVVGQCVGVVHHHPDKVSELYVDEVGTADAYLRQGIARALMAELFRWGRETGCAEAWLGTEVDNEAAKGLYRALGGTEDTIKYYEFKL
ncbi:GNAT family N-acetyltransferase [Devosia rhodophyticola]|uniref:GNAT family N-acetyltransferase n=1 Tax=Devosia rhodophyticola TaxID=3026423 RepID=A0ABY7YT91_9HYPH|nr:GNAT family N-acetyltransferase [Devosia rhodophyticola]WDR04407.1 GNAT family N-acetyltransferase [Devosia rhodophyticola]